MSYTTNTRARSIRRPALLGALALTAAVAACAEQGEPTAPAPTLPAEAALAEVSTAAAPTELTADAIGRLLPMLDADAAAPVGNALAALDAKLRDRRATLVATQRAAAAVQNVLAEFTDPARPDAADLDAMRLEADDISAALR